MARKVFISFLGFTDYRFCKYHYGVFKSENTRFIQIATLDYLLTQEEWSPNDVAYILLTKGAEEKNWIDNGQIDFQTKQKKRCDGLETCFKTKNYPFKVEPIKEIKDGNDEQELFDIFKKTFSLIKEGDTLYFDVTHGFRSLPMLILVLINYAKFLKNVEVKSITYGNYEARKKSDSLDDAGCDLAPIIDLLPLSGIQDWAFVAADFIKNGNAERFKELVKEHRTSIIRGFKSGNKEHADELDYLANSLQNVTSDFQTCRGINILETKNISTLLQKLEDIGTSVIEPMNPIIEKLKEAFSVFSTSGQGLQYKNGFEAAKWCIEHRLFQQAATILQENIVTFFCEKYHLDIYDIDERKKINAAFAFHKILKSSNTTKEEKEQIIETIQRDDILQRLMADDLISDKKINAQFGKLTDERNDINHNGMKKEVHDVNTIRKNIYEALKAFNSPTFTDL